MLKSISCYRLVKLNLLLSVLLLSSCNALNYTRKVEKKFPELGTIGKYQNYVLENKLQPKTVVDLNKAIRLKATEIKISKRNFLSKKEEKSLTDSTLVSFEILDVISLVQGINKDKELLQYLKNIEGYKLVSQVDMHFSNTVLMRLREADELYLIQNKEKTLSIELRTNNVAIDTIAFIDGRIVDYGASQFCWGQSLGTRIEILDIVPSGAVCEGQSYKSVRRATRKNEFKF